MDTRLFRLVHWFSRVDFLLFFALRVLVLPFFHLFHCVDLPFFIPSSFIIDSYPKPSLTPLLDLDRCFGA